VECAVAATARDDVERTRWEAVDAVPGDLVRDGGATVAVGRERDMGAREQLRVRVGVKTKKKGGAEAPPLIELPGLLQNW
jgi:hypothetical protein